MADNPITTPLPADLPEQWTYGQTVGPNGTDVGLTEQHGYNYLMRQVNATQEGVNALGEAFAEVPVLEGGKVPVSQLPVGTPNGVAGLDSAGKVPSSQLPDMDYVPLSGGTMTGPLVLPGDPTASLQAAPKQYVDNALNDITPSGIGAAPASHTHAATDITSGVLPIANGGTGGIDAESALYNLITGPNTNMGMYGITRSDKLPVADVEDGIGRGLPIGNLADYLNEIEKMARLQTGSYVGTGTYGSSNPCRLQLDFKPQLFILFGKSNSNTSYRDMIIAIRGDTQLAFTISHGSNPSSPVSTGLIFSWGSKYLTWYASSLNNQLNASGVTYNWLVAGA